MTVYVDAPTWTKPVKNPRKSYAHMVADTHQELHEFAAKIGVKKHFIHRAGCTHYDITSEQHAVAVANGATEVDTREVLRVGKLADRAS